MTAERWTPAGWPAWVPKAAALYLRHIEEGQSLRAIARDEGCHPSTILRQVRAYENRRDDPLIDEALTRIGASLRAAGLLVPSPAAPQTCPQGAPAMTAPQSPRSPATACLPDLPTLHHEARRILRRMAEPEAVLAVSGELDKAIVLRGTARTAVVDRAIAEAFAVKGWIGVQSAGRVCTYTLTGAGRSALRDLLGAGEDSPQAARVRASLSESPVQVLARRREKDGRPFLGPDLVAAAERLREDFEIAQVGPRVAQDWDRFLTGASPTPSETGARDGAMRARDRVALALRDLGPGLGDMVLRCCCYLEGLESAEQRMGWSARSGKIVLRIALARLKRHYDETYGGRMPLIG